MSKMRVVSCGIMADLAKLVSFMIQLLDGVGYFACPDRLWLDDDMIDSRWSATSYKIVDWVGCSGPSPGLVIS